ncbi:MAG: hypothetical protein KVP17_002923 [Porospora cf. gigantea B]|uniref:uncharacterized protein n=2 Tax=Porospora cf. gigantea B TaxID=2853592 RepID=UPI003571DD8F|nr:MAG: hypothetical protein KVP17_002923 [Porospora cf. gigantea B]
MCDFSGNALLFVMAIGLREPLLPPRKGTKSLWAGLLLLTSAIVLLWAVPVPVFVDLDPAEALWVARLHRTLRSENALMKGSRDLQAQVESLPSVTSLPSQWTDDDVTVSAVQFWMKFNKTYDAAAEKFRRLQIFHSQMLEAEAIAGQDQGFRLGATFFSDIPKSEDDEYMGLKTNMIPPTLPLWQPPLHFQLPGDVDWRTVGCVRQPKNQQKCGSCWAFATVAALESAVCIAGLPDRHPLPNYSEQELLDCSWFLGDRGCNGGLTEWGAEYVADWGLCPEEEYEYTASDGDCRSKSCHKSHSWRVDRLQALPPDTQALMAALVTNGPITVAITAGNIPFKLYQGGILRNTATWSCEGPLDHAVTLIGFGEENGAPFWIIKNSWGTDWGEGGFMRMSTRSDAPYGMCNILQEPVLVSVRTLKNNTTSV